MRPSTTTPDERGDGDELHQGVERGERMTTATGTPLGDGQNSLKVGDRGPRADVVQGYQSVMREEAGPTRRMRAESFADHFSQADKLAMPLPEASEAAVPTRTDLPESPALSILLNGTDSFAGRKLGVLVNNGSDKAVVRALASTFEDAGAVVEYVAPAIGPVKLKGGGTITPDHAHHKVVGLGADAGALLDAAGVAPDEGFIDVASADDAAVLLTRCASLRHWDRDVRA